MHLVTPSVTLLHATPESLIVHAGRHSYQSHPKANEQSDAQLLTHFVNKRESPLEHSFAMFDVTCSYAVHVHFVRHRVGTAFSWLSQRYTHGLGFMVPPGVTDPAVIAQLEQAYTDMEALYDRLRALKLHKQAARYVMPQGVAMRGSMSGNARAFLTMLDLRTSKAAMPETQIVARALRAELSGVWPTIFPVGESA